MIQSICIAFFIIWAFWTWACSNGLSLIENALFALLPALISTVVLSSAFLLVAGAFGVFAK